MKPFPRLALLFLAGAARLLAQGGPPFITDDPGTPGDGHWEVNIAWTRERRPDESTDELPLFDINYGVGDRIQLKYEGSCLVEREAGQPAEHGFSNSLVGVKWRFYDDEKGSGLTLSTYPQFEFRNPGSNSAARGLTDEGTTLLLPLEIQREKDGWGVNVDFGAILPSRTASGWFYGVVFGHEFTERLEAGVELHGEAASKFQRTSLTANVGVRWKLDEHCVLLGAVGREVHNGIESRASLVSYLAVQLLR